MRHLLYFQVVVDEHINAEILNATHVLFRKHQRVGKGKVKANDTAEISARVK
jgi:hypothetical protein